MEAADILTAIAAPLDKPVLADAFSEAFLDFVGLAEDEPYDADLHPELEELFDACVRYQDELAASIANDAQKKAQARKLANLVFAASRGKVHITIKG